MVLSGRTESGAEEWSCPTCGRRLLLRWPPRYEKLVLDHGDDAVVHVGGKGGLTVGGVGVAPATAGEPTADGKMSGAERQWLRDNGIEWDSTPA